jgi:heat shock protein HslJ
MKNLKTLAAISLAVVITACCACRGGKNTVPLTGTEWKLTQLNGAAITSADGFRMTLGDDGKISGRGDCNRYNGTFTQKAGGSRTNGGLTVSQNLVSTRMMCPNQALETEFLKMLGQIDSWSIDGQRLMLIREGNVLAIFDPAPVTAD